MKVSLVGAGPGDPALCTLRGKELLEEADVVIYDALATPALLNFCPNAEQIYVGKVADKHALPQEQINELLANKARENGGKKVVRLKGGDPFIFGRGGEEAEYLADQNIPFETVPGVTSAIAAPALAGIPLTHRDYASSFSIITGHEQPGKEKSSINWQSLANSGSTLAFVMGMKNLAGIEENLLAAGMPAETPAAIIQRGATPLQRVLKAQLKGLAASAEKQKFTSPAVIVIGKVAALGEKLDWFSKRPLFGKRVAVTRARAQASQITRAFQDLGAYVLECPSIRIEPLQDYGEADAAIRQLSEYAWILFTSVNGVEYFWRRLANAGRDSRALAKVRIGAIGPATAKALQDKGIKADFIPSSFVAERAATELIEGEGLGIRGQKILIPRAAKARDALPEELQLAGALTNVIPVYQTEPDKFNAAEVLDLINSDRLDCVTFGSSSTVENFLALVLPDALKAHPHTQLAAIGPITAKTLDKYGLKAAITPQKFTMRDLVQAVVSHFTNPGDK